LVHNLSADNTFGDIAVALGKSRMRHRIKSSAMRTKEAAAFRDWPCKRHIGCLHVKASMHLKEYYFQRYAGRASQPLPQPLVIISIMTLRSSLTCARARNECHKRFFACPTRFRPGLVLNARLFHGKTLHRSDFPSVSFRSGTAMLHLDVKRR
jgi:hypothetical protein